MRPKYLLFLLVIFIVFSINVFAQLYGIKTIPGDYATIALAISDLNTQGVGGGGVTFNVAAGYTESITAPILFTATGTSANPILFQRSGAGANPKITRTDGGTNSTSTVGGQGDAVLIIQGSDYVTIDAIDVVASSQGIEYGYYLRKASGTDGCKYVTIKNCVIDLTKGTSQYVAGIYSSNNDASSLVSSAVGITITSEGGRHENITITGNTVQDIFAGILLRGFNHTSSPYNFYDQNFVVGVNGAGNTIQNFAGNSANASYGVYLIYHNNANVSFNTINNTAGGGSNFTWTGYGIFHSDATNGSGTYNNNNINLYSNTGQLKGIMSGTAGIATLTANNNTIVLSQVGTSEASCIHFQFLSASSTVTINNNTFSYGTFASTSTSYLINSSNAASNVTVSGNQTGLINKTGAGTFYCFYNAGSPSGGSGLVQNNIFTNITLTGASTFYGIYYTGSTSQPKTISGNTISNVTGGTNSVYGIYTSNDGAGSQTRQNEVNNISGAGAIYGLWSGAGNNSGHINSNSIYNLSSTSSTGPVRGINVDGGTVYVYNNFVSDLKMPAGNAAETITGIYVNAGNTVSLFFNTIYLNASSSGALFGTACIRVPSTTAIDMRNNILVNISIPNGTNGRTITLRAQNTLFPNSYSTNSNNNCFYSGIPGPNNLIFFNGTNGDQTISQFKSRVGPTRDAASFTEDVPFVNKTTTPYDLHINTILATLTESGGIAVSSPISVTDDYDSDTRNVTPDVGADEFAGTSTDPDPPIISYALLKRGSVSSPRVFSGVSITDQRGVNTAPGTAPRVYYKKSINANTFNGNTSATEGWKYVEGSNVGSIFSFSLNYSLLFGGTGVSVGDVIQYFVVAQDLSPQQNVGINSGTFNSQPSSVNLTTANFPIGGTINSYPVVESISGTILVGSGETFTTLTANNSQGLFRYINERVVVGNITVSITSNTLESGEVSLDETVDEGSSYITFRPSSASEKIVFSSAAYPAAVIKINGADRIIFDGRFGGGGNYLSFVNSDFTGSQAIAAIQIISLGPNAGATGITIRNCNISTYYSNGVTSYGITSGGATVGTAGYDNDNLTMIDNVITRALYGININGNAEGKANNIVITGNAIGSDTPINYIGKYGIHIIWADDVNISGNIIFNIISDYQSLYGISLSFGVTNAVISANKIYSIRYTGDVSWGGIGIEISKSGNNANNLISNNLIYDIWGDGGNYDSFLDHNPFGIYLGSDQTGIKVYNNSINLYGNSLNKSGAISVGIGLNSLSFADIRNNIIVNSLGLESDTGYGSVGIFLKTGSSQLVSSNNNIIFVNPSGSGVKYIGQINATGYSNIQSWRTATGKDIYSYSGAPAFTSNTNLLPDNSNPDCWVFNNKGMPLTDVATDFNGVLRSTTVAGGPVDIGAYEFDAATNIYPPIALQGGIIGNGLTTTYNVFEFESASMSWSGTSLPSTIELRFYSGIEPPGADNNTSKCYWDITQTGGSSFTYDITFTYDPAQIGVITSEDDIRLAKSNDNGVNWIPFLSSGTGAEHYLLNTADNTIKVHGLSSFSLFALTDVDGALPVELNSFSAAVSGRDINLKWETETEVNSYGFEIERASSSNSPLQGWEKVGFVEGHGNSNSPKQYSFTDKNLNSGKYIYRLKMVDNDGSYEYSPEVESEIDAPKDYLLSQNYPNPFNPSTKIDYQLPFESNVMIELYNITGERVDVLVNQEQAAGYYTVEVNSTQFRLSSGIYIYRMTAVSSKDAKSYTQLKKMVLLK